MRSYNVISFGGVHTSSLCIENHNFVGCRDQAEFAAGVEWRRGTVYNGGEIQGGFADEI